MKDILFLLTLSALFCLNASAYPTASDTDSMIPVAYFQVGSMNSQLLDPPPEIRRLVTIEFASLERHRGVALDINGVRDYFFSDNPNGCGSGGCPIILIDGAQKKIIGEFFGNPVFVMKKEVNGYPIIQVYSHGGSSNGCFSAYLYSGERYTEVSSILTEGKALAEMYSKLTASPGKCLSQ